MEGVVVVMPLLPPSPLLPLLLMMSPIFVSLLSPPLLWLLFFADARLMSTLTKIADDNEDKSVNIKNIKDIILTEFTKVKYIKKKIYPDAHLEQSFKPLTEKQTRDWYSMNHQDFMDKWKDKL